jgi:hypothetical protein
MGEKGGGGESPSLDLGKGSGLKGRHATGGGAVFWVGWSVYNRLLRKKLIGLFCGDCEEFLQKCHRHKS